MTRFAAIDCGTNSTRLLIVEEDGTNVFHDLVVTRLGSGVDSSKALDSGAITRTIDVLTRYRAVLDEHKVDQVDVVVTSAARDASNSEDFFAAVEKAVGVRPRLLSGEEEGLVTYIGGTAGLTSPPYLVLDIGGGSTEFVLGDESGTKAISIDTGCVRLTEQMLPSDPPAPEELTNAFAIVEDWLSDVSSTLPIEGVNPTFVGVAGTITTLAGMDLGLTSYDHDRLHHHTLTREGTEEIFRSLSGQTIAERRTDPTLPDDRADVIVAGAVIFLAVMRHFSFDNCLVSDSDILVGLTTESRLRSVSKHR